MAFNLNDIEEAIGNIATDHSGSVSWYIGNLRKNNEFFVCNLSHLLLRNCDSLGELSSKEDYIFVQVLGCKTPSGLESFIFNCRNCNKSASSVAKSLRSIPTLNEAFITKVNSSCIHTCAAQKLHSSSMFEGKFSYIEKEDVDVQVLRESPYLCVVLAGGSYSLIKILKKNSPSCCLNTTDYSSSE